VRQGRWGDWKQMVEHAEQGSAREPTAGGLTGGGATRARSGPTVDAAKSIAAHAVELVRDKLDESLHSTR
jgi:hypothetical protein